MRHKYTKNINNVYSGLRGLQLDFSSLSSELLVMSVIGSRMKKKLRKPCPGIGRSYTNCYCFGLMVELTNV